MPGARVNPVSLRRNVQYYQWNPAVLAHFYFCSSSSTRREARFAGRKGLLALVFVVIVFVSKLAALAGTSTVCTCIAGSGPPRTAASQTLNQLAGNLFKEAGGDTLFRCVVSVAAAVLRAGKNQRVHGPGHAHVTEAALLFQLIGIVEGARVGEEALLKSGKKDQREFQSLGCVQRHQGNARLGVELVGIRGQRRVIEKLSQGLAAGFRVVGRVGQFLQVFNTAERLR